MQNDISKIKILLKKMYEDRVWQDKNKMFLSKLF